MKYVDAEKDKCIACGFKGMILFSTDGGNNFNGKSYTMNDWVTIEANSEVTVFGGRNFFQTVTNLIAYTYDHGENVHIANVETTEGIYDISLRDYPAVYYCTVEGKIFKSDSNFTDWQEYAKMDSKPFYTMYDPQGNL